MPKLCPSWSRDLATSILVGCSRHSKAVRNGGLGQLDPFFDLCPETIDEIVTTLWDRSDDPDESVKPNAISLMSIAAIVYPELAKVVVDALLKQSSSAQAAAGIAISVKLAQTTKICG